MTDHTDAFDRAAAREAELRETAEELGARKERRHRRSLASSVEGLAFFSFLFPIHYLVAGTVNRWIIAHLVMIALCGTDVVGKWVRSRSDS